MNKQTAIDLLKILDKADKARREAEYEPSVSGLVINWEYIIKTVEKYYLEDKK